ncbi:START-like domain superfamily [Sesbania bispinosa]|nr:START-like domain superfamily [Sesbania bispinosa]
MKSCNVIVGAVREVSMVSNFPTESITKRLEILDDERHVISFNVIGGDHRLRSYQFVTTFHPNGNETLVIKSYVVDIPLGNTKEDTFVCVDTIVRCNLQSLAQIAKNVTRNSEQSS